MPKYTVDQDIYDIPEDQSVEFEKEFPSAKVAYVSGKDVYDIPLSDRDEFLQQFPDALYYNDKPASHSESPEIEAFNHPVSELVKANQNEVTPYMVRPPMPDVPVQFPGDKVPFAPGVPSTGVPHEPNTTKDANEGREIVDDGYVFTGEELGIQENTPKDWALNTLRDRRVNISPSGVQTVEQPSDFAEVTQEIASRGQEYDYPRMDYIPSYITNTDRLRRDIESELSSTRFEKVNAEPISPLTPPGSIREFRNKKYSQEGRYFETALRFVEKSERLIGAEQNNKTFVQNVSRGAGESLTDPNVWLSGMPEFGDNLDLVEVLKKEDKGEDLTDGEQMLLDAAANYSLTQMYANLPRGYKAGNQFGQQIPFMLSIVAGGAIAKTALSGVKKQMLKYIAKKATGKATKGLAKAGMHVLAIGAKGTAAEMIQPGLVLNDAAKRMVGDVAPGTEYAGREDSKGVTEALGRAIVSQNIEYTSEQVGEFGRFLTPILKRVGAPIVDRLAGSGIAKAIKAMDATEMKRFLQKGAWNGFAPEVAEEYVANIMHIATGDQEWGSLADKDQFIDTVVGVGTTMGFFEGAKTLNAGANAAARYGTRRAYENAQKKATSTLGAESMTVLDSDDAQAITRALDSMTPEQRAVATEYVYRRSAWDATRISINKRAEALAQDAESVILNNTNQDTGAIERATLDEKEDVVVLSGTFEAESETDECVGSAVMLTIRHEDGTIEQVDRDRITVFQREDATLMAQQAKESAFNEVIQAEADAMSYGSENNPQPGVAVRIGGKNLTIEQVNPDGTATMLDGSGVQSIVSLDNIRDAIQERIEASEEGIPYEGEELQIDGEMYEFTGRNLGDRYEFVQFNEDGDPVGSKSLTTEQYKGLAAGQVAQPSLEGTTDERTEVQPSAATLEAEPVQETVPVPGETQSENPPEIQEDLDNVVDPMSFIPFSTDKKGKTTYQFEQAEPKHTAAALSSIYEDDTPEFVDGKIAELTKQRATYFEKNGKIKGFLDPSEYSANKKAVATIDGTLAYWNAIRSIINTNKTNNEQDIQGWAPDNGLEIQQTKTPVEAEKQPKEHETKTEDVTNQNISDSISEDKEVSSSSEKQNRKKTYSKSMVPTIASQVAAMGDYLNVTDYILRAIATGQRFLWTSRNGRRGLDVELGMRSEKERKARYMLIGNNGTTPEEMAEYIYPQADVLGIPLGGMDENDIRGEVISIISSLSGNTRRGALDQLRSLHSHNTEQEDDYYQQQYEAELAAYLADIGLYDEILAAELELLTEDQQNAIQSLFIDEIDNTFDENTQDDGNNPDTTDNEGSRIDNGGTQGVGPESDQPTASGGFDGRPEGGNNEPAGSAIDPIEQGAEESPVRDGGAETNEPDGPSIENGEISGTGESAADGVQQSGIRESSVQGSVEPTLPRTVRDLVNLDVGTGNGLVSGMLLSSLKEGDTFKVGRDRVYTVSKRTKPSQKQYNNDTHSGEYTSTNVSIIDDKGKKYSYELRDNWTHNGKVVSSRLIAANTSRKSNPVAQLSRDIEGDISVDLINEFNPFHKKSDSYKIIEAILNEKNSKNQEAELTPEEQRAAEETAARIDDEISSLKTTITNKQKAYEAKKLEIGREYAKDKQLDMFETAKLASGMFTEEEIERDFSDSNISSILQPLQQEIINHTDKLNTTIEGREKAINDAIQAVRLQTTIEQAESEVNTNPTEGQKEAGNYKMGHVTIQGMDISIENPKGSTRSGVAPSGKSWSIEMQNSYGYFKRSTGKDGDHIDVFLGENPESQMIFVVDQVNQDGSFDESKVMLGFNGEQDARESYLSNYEDGWQGLGVITPVPVEKFKEWLYDGARQRKPFSEYVDIKDESESPADTKGSDPNIKYAENPDGSLKSKNDYTPEEWEAYTSSVVDQKVDKNPVVTIKSHNDFLKRLYSGQVTIDEFKAEFEATRNSREHLKSELSTKTKPELLKMVGAFSYYRNKNEKKEYIIDTILDEIDDDFYLSDTMTISWGQRREDIVAAKVDKYTQVDLDEYRDKVQQEINEREARIAAKKKALENPETLEEFRLFIREKGYDALNNDQRATYDLFVSDATKERKQAEIAKKPEKKPESTKSTLSYGEFSNTKTGNTMYAVSLESRVSADEYKRINAIAKTNGGYYSSYNKGGAIPGFLFKSKEMADKFMLEATPQGAPTEEETAEEMQNQAASDSPSIVNNMTAEKLRQSAEKLIEDAEESLNKDRLTNTVKRAREAGYAEDKARESKRMGQTMLNIADAIESGSVKLLDGIRTKSHIELLDSLLNQARYKEMNDMGLSYEERLKFQENPISAESVEHLTGGLFPEIYSSSLEPIVRSASNKSGMKKLAKKWGAKINYGTGSYKTIQIRNEAEMNEVIEMFNTLSDQDKKYHTIGNIIADYKRLRAMGIDNDSMLRAALREYAQYRGKKQESDKVKELERAIVGSNVGVDFFPTPEATADRMVEEADIQEGMSVLEPSAGNGNIADAIRRASAEPDVAEISTPLSEILSAKGYNVVAKDFMEMEGAQYDRIIMNPPFSNGMDGEHVMHAYDLLKPGGRIVAVVGEGTFIRNDKKAAGFREWLDSVGGSSENLPQGTFNDRKLLNSTMANARLVIVDKAESGGDARFRTSVRGLIDKLDKTNINPNERHAAAVNLIGIISKKAGLDNCVVVRNNEDAARSVSDFMSPLGLARLVAGLNEHQRTGFALNGRTVIISENCISSTEMLKTWLHEQVHLVSSSVLSQEEKASMLDNFSEEELINLIGRNTDLPGDLQAEEALAYSVESILDNATIDEIMDGEVDLSEFPVFLQDPMGKIIDKIRNENEKGTTPPRGNGNRPGGGKTNEASQLSSGGPISEVPADTEGKSQDESGGSTEDVRNREGQVNLAPNGKPSNLTPAQYTQVRTPEFKAWFGDWEKNHRLEKLRKSKPISLSYKNANPDINSFRELEYEKAKALRGEYLNLDTQKIIQVNRTSINEVKSHAFTEVDAASLSFIPEFIKNAILIEPGVANENTGKSHVKSYDYYVLGAKINGKDYTVRIAVANKDNGESYYDHGLTQMEKGRLMDFTRLSNSLDAQEPPFSDIKDKRLLSVLQDNSSKVLDENGEPLVVYHGTGEDFSEFKSEIKLYGGNTTIFTNRYGFFFTPSRVTAAKHGNSIIPVFLNVRNPKTIGKGQGQGKRNGFKGSDYLLRKEDREKVESMGYDGFYLPNYSELVGKHTKIFNISQYVVFNSTQIKSAVGNNGQFDGENPNILFRDVLDGEILGMQKHLGDNWEMTPGEISEVKIIGADEELEYRKKYGIASILSDNPAGPPIGVVYQDDNNNGRVVAFRPESLKSQQKPTRESIQKLIDSGNFSDAAVKQLRAKMQLLDSENENSPMFRMSDSEKALRRLERKVENRDAKIVELNEQILDLRQNIRDEKRDTKDNVRSITSFAKAHVNAEVFNNMQRSEYASIMDEIASAVSNKELSLPFSRLLNIIEEVKIRTAQNTLDNLLSLKIQDQNNKGVSIAKNVDERTRSLMASIREEFNTLGYIPKSEEYIALNERETLLREESKGEIDPQRRYEIKREMNIIKAQKSTIRDRVKRSESSRKADAVRSIEERLDKIWGLDEWTDEIHDEILMLQTVKNLAEILACDADLIDNSLDIDAVSRIRRGEPGYESKADKLNKLEGARGTLLREKSVVIRQSTELLEGLVNEGRSNLTEWMSAKNLRRKELLSMAYGAVKGRPLPEPNKETNKPIIDYVPVFFKSWLWSFDWALRHIDRNHIQGMGPLYNYFMRSPKGTQAASDLYNVGRDEFNRVIDEKAKEMFGMPYQKLAKESGKVIPESVHIFDEEGGAHVRDFSRGQALYVYMIWQMEDGQTKLRNQGFTEESMSEIEALIGPKYMEFAAWAQDDFLPKLREDKYNQTHIRMFGTSMRFRDHYFPFKIDKSSLFDKGEIGEDFVGMPSTITGNIINRTVNNLPIDTEQNALQVLERYGDTMEKWNAYAEVTDDLNQIIKSRYVRNQMNANEAGSFSFFKDAAAVAVRQFENRLDSRSNWAKGFGRFVRLVAMSKISFRLSTAMKQILSLPAFLDYSLHPGFVASLVKNLSFVGRSEEGSFQTLYQWAADNLPSYKERVHSGYFGNEILQYEHARSATGKAIDLAGNYGMFANRMVDAFASAIGAKTVYDYALAKYSKHHSVIQARNMALYDAEIIFNQTQQSSEPNYISPSQADGHWANRAMTTFMNNNIGYYRKMVDGFEFFMRDRKRLIRHLTEQYQDEKRKNPAAEAVATWNKEAGRNAFRIGLFGLGLQTLWAVGGIGVLGFGGDDKKRKRAATIGAITAPLQGLPLLGDFATTVASYRYDVEHGVTSRVDISPIMLFTEAQNITQQILGAPEQIGASRNIIEAVFTGLLPYGGINAETYENIILGAHEIIKGGLAKDLDQATVGALFVINLPPSQRKDVAARLFKDRPMDEFIEKMAIASKAMEQAKGGWMTTSKPRTTRLMNDLSTMYYKMQNPDWVETDEQYKIVQRRANKFDNEADKYIGDSLGLAKFVNKNRNMANLLNDKEFKDARNAVDNYEAKAKKINKYQVDNGMLDKPMTYNEVMRALNPNSKPTDDGDYTQAEYREAAQAWKQVAIDKFNQYDKD